MTIPIGLLIPYQDKIRDVALDLYQASSDLHDLADSLDDLTILIANHARSVNQEMNKFEEGFSHDRTKTTSKRGKKPVVHCMEPKRNKRKLN